MIRTTLLLLLCATPSVAQNINLALPLDCVLGETCFIQQYPDRDAGPDATDFSCGPLTYDTHSGTDFALPTVADLTPGVEVLAAAAGEVMGVRNDMPDILQGQPGAPEVAERECGNGLVIRHPDGWETQYCHMAQGSVRVQPGQTVAQGDVLGLVGRSGQTQFPHLHLSVRHDGAEIDPFDPDQSLTCGQTAPQLWAEPITYVPGALIAAGFSSTVPEYDAIRAGGLAETLTISSPALVLWGFAYGGQAGDMIRITITGPAGEVTLQEAALEREQAQFLRAAGSRLNGAAWAPGEYVGTIDMIRNYVVIDSMTVPLTLD